MLEQSWIVDKILEQVTSGFFPLIVLPKKSI